MRSIVGFIAIALLFTFISCTGAQSISGVWANWELYKNWTVGIVDEASQPIDAVVDGISYIEFPNSIIISLSKKSIVVPGGAWNIVTIKPENKSKTILLLCSRKNSEYKGVIAFNYLSSGDIYFTIESMDDNFRKEFNQTFLLVGKENHYSLCKPRKR
jgi:hypothetical protein